MSPPSRGVKTNVVGEMSNRYFYNENYILAASLGLYSTMGRRAGAAAAQDAAQK